MTSWSAVGHVSMLGVLATDFSRVSRCRLPREPAVLALPRGVSAGSAYVTQTRTGLCSFPAKGWQFPVLQPRQVGATWIRHLPLRRKQQSRGWHFQAIGVFLCGRGAGPPLLRCGGRRDSGVGLECRCQGEAPRTGGACSLESPGWLVSDRFRGGRLLADSGSAVWMSGSLRPPQVGTASREFCS